MVIQVCSGTRKKLLHTKLKLGWLICSTDEYLVARRCFKFCRFNHRHQDCRDEETCPLCAGKHKLKEGTAPEMHYKCINCVTYNRYTKGEKISECPSSRDKNCPRLQAVLAEYRLNTDYWQWRLHPLHCLQANLLLWTGGVDGSLVCNYWTSTFNINIYSANK